MRTGSVTGLIGVIETRLAQAVLNLSIRYGVRHALDDL
jgi:hypothetical protein